METKMNKVVSKHHQKSRDKKCIMDDEAVREARRLYESMGAITQQQLATQFNVKLEYMKRVLNYDTSYWYLIDGKIVKKTKPIKYLIRPFHPPHMTKKSAD
jgi:catalase